MKHKKLLTNLLFAAVVLAIAAVLLLVRSAHSSGSKLRAELIYGDNNTTMNLPLDKNDTYDVVSGLAMAIKASPPNKELTAVLLSIWYLLP